MSTSYENVNLKQIDYIKHALGYEARKVNRRKYEAYRNYFTTANNDKTWDNLVELGLAEKRPFPNGCGENPQVYFVTYEGKKMLGDLLGIKITEID